MKNSILIVFFSCFILAKSASITNKEVVCFVNTTRFIEGFQISNFKESLKYCNNVILGFSTLDPKTYKIQLNAQIEEPIKNFGNNLQNIKKEFPNVKKIYFSVGGGQDLEKNKNKYLEIFESMVNFQSFADSAVEIIKKHGFDGIDLAWQFPTTKDKNVFELVTSKIKNIFSSEKKKFENYRQLFVFFVSEIRKKLDQVKNSDLTLTVLPNINNSVFFDVKSLMNSFNSVNLLPLDCSTPTRDPKDQYSPAPIENGLIEGCSAKDYVEYWNMNNQYYSKIYLGIPTYGRTWKVLVKQTTRSSFDIRFEGPGKEGERTHEKGLLSYDEICKLKSQKGYEAKEYNQENSGSTIEKYPSNEKEEGIVVGYDSLNYIEKKVEYAMKNNLAGLALFDITLDDFKGTCEKEPYPILRKINQLLNKN